MKEIRCCMCNSILGYTEASPPEVLFYCVKCIEVECIEEVDD